MQLSYMHKCHPMYYDLDDDRKQFCFFKAFDQTENTFEGLQVPTNYFLDYIMKDTKIVFEVVHLLRNSLKFSNRELSNTKKNRKYLKVAHL